MILRNSSFSQVPNSFTGNKHFRESDYTVHRTPTWLASVRMASERVIGTELVNEDNLKGYYMADGALYTYVYGDGYHNIFPFGIGEESRGLLLMKAMRLFLIPIKQMREITVPM